MECPRCHETVLDTDVLCGKCGYRFDVDNHDDFTKEDVESVKKPSYDFDVSSEKDEAAIKSERRAERVEKVDALRKKSQAQWDQIVASGFMKDLKLLLSNGIRRPEATKNDSWYATLLVPLTVLAVFILLYSLMLFVPVANMDGFSMSRIGGTGLATFSYILLGHTSLILLGFVYVFIINTFLSDKKSSFAKLLSDYTVLLIPVFIVLLFAWLMMIVGLTLIGLAIYLLSLLLLLIIPLYMLFDGPHTKLKSDAYQFIILYVIIAGTLLFLPLVLVLDQMAVFFLSGSI